MRTLDSHTKTELKEAELPDAVLSLLAIIYGSSASWSTMALEYYVQSPTDSRYSFDNPRHLHPSSIGTLASAQVASALSNIAKWNTAYKGGIGFLNRDMLYPSGFAKLILVLPVLSGPNFNILTCTARWLAVTDCSSICTQSRLHLAICLFRGCACTGVNWSFRTKYLSGGFLEFVKILLYSVHR